MRLLFLLLGFSLLTLSGCAQINTRDEGSHASTATPGETSRETLYRLPATQARSAAQDPTNPRADYGLWTRLGQNFTMHTIEHERIDAEVFAYQSNIDDMHSISKRAEPYLFFIVEQLRERGMPLELALLPIVESSYQPQATSRSQAAGLWQFIPSTGTHYGLKQNWWYDGRRDVYASTHAALDYLQNLNNTFNGDWALSLAAYNAGQGTVGRAIQKAEANGQPSDYWSLDLPNETQHYVPRLLALARIFHDPHVYGLTPHRVEDKSVFTKITLDKPLDLSKIASAISMSEADLYRFNPAFKRGINGHGQDVVALLLPHDKAEQLRELDMEKFHANIASPRRITINKTESLAAVAKRYGVKPSDIRQVNPTLNEPLKRGQTLFIPTNYMIASQATATRTAQADRAPQLDPLKLPGKERYAITTTHAVAPGDNLFSVSRQYGVSPNELAAWNKLTTQSSLKVGQKLTVHRDRPNNPSVSTPPFPKAITYTVKKGDTLHAIAQRFKVSVAQLREWNRLKEKDNINLGQTIIVAMGSKTDAANPT